MPLTHSQKEKIALTYVELTQARNLVAAMRSLTYFNGFNVDAVTLRIVDMQNHLEEVLRSGEIPAQPSFGL